MQNNSIFSLKKRLLAVFLLVSFLFLLIIIRLGYLQLIKGSWLQSKAIDQWTRELPLNAVRGDIRDTNGVTLATNYSTYDIYVRPSMVENNNMMSVEDVVDILSCELIGIIPEDTGVITSTNKLISKLYSVIV